MLSDFLTLELYFGSGQSALYVEDLLKHFSSSQIRKALKDGDIECRTIQLGPDKGRLLYRLSAQGRIKLLEAPG